MSLETIYVNFTGGIAYLNHQIDLEIYFLSMDIMEFF